MATDRLTTDQLTIYDLQEREDVRVDVRQLPRLARYGIRLTLAAGRREFLTSTALQIVSGAALGLALLVGNQALQALLEVQTAGSGLAPLIPWAVLLAILTAASTFAGAVQREQQQILGELVSRHMQTQTLGVAARVDLLSFERPEFHNRLQRVQSSVQQPLNMVYGLSGLSSALVGVAGVSIALLAIQPLIIPMVLLVLLPAWMAASRRGSEFWRYFWRMTPKDRERNYLGQLLAGRDEAKEVRAFGLGRHLLARWQVLFEDRIRELRNVARRQLVYSLASTLTIAILLGGTVLLIGWLASTGQVSLSEAGIALAGIAVIGSRLTGAGYSAASLSEAGFYLDDFAAFLAMGATSDPPPAPAPPGFTSIVADNVSFTYPSGETPALIDVSVEIRAGEVVALVGENGSGKSTLAKVLAGLYTPRTGTVTWDGVDLATIDQTELSQKVAVIFQDFIRYHLSAGQNIGFGDIDRAPQAEVTVEVAAEQAGADEFIARLPDGYETLLGPEFLGGVDLSVGQWQRMALARAFYRDAPLVILDEPTAALDARAEHDLFIRIRKLLAGRTVLLISHRFSSVRNADRVYVLHEGRLIESGRHAELVAAGGRYAEMYALQAEAYQDRG
jgi:ABC-type multidrug transport system fused ATPase/permease subunit